jgi:predicted nuclease of predicted toxin-antitoxin system
MPYRILVDEDTEPSIAVFLRERGHDAEHVQEHLGKGTLDPQVIEYAQETDRIILTYDDDFLDPDLNDGAPILHIADKQTTVTEVVDAIEQLDEWGAASTDLRPHTIIPSGGF